MTKQELIDELENLDFVCVDYDEEAKIIQREFSYRWKYYQNWLSLNHNQFYFPKFLFQKTIYEKDPTNFHEWHLLTHYLMIGKIIYRLKNMFYDEMFDILIKETLQCSPKGQELASKIKQVRQIDIENSYQTKENSQ